MWKGKFPYLKPGEEAKRSDFQIHVLIGKRRKMNNCVVSQILMPLMMSQSLRRTETDRRHASVSYNTLKEDKK